MSMQTDSLNALERTYCFFAKGFEYPDPKFWDEVEGRPLRDLAGLENDAGFLNGIADDSFPIREQQEREVEFVSTFEGRSLQQYEGSCRPRVGRDGILEEVLRFYHHFGLKLSETRRDFPDNFITELEFMAHLVRLQRDSAKQGGDQRPFMLAQRDFLVRHLALWAEELPNRLARMEIDNSFSILAAWLNGFVRSHIAHLCDALGPDDEAAVIEVDEPVADCAHGAREGQ